MVINYIDFNDKYPKRIKICDTNGYIDFNDKNPKCITFEDGGGDGEEENELKL